VGTLLADKGSTAFFDGTESGFRKALRVGDRIAGFEIQQVHYAGVRLLDGTNTLDLRVGSGLRREDSGPWKSSSGGTAYAATSSSRSSDSSRWNGGDSRDRNSYSRPESAPAGSSSSESAPDPNADEILRKLMEKRAKE
jgi:hypothetical protein